MRAALSDMASSEIDQRVAIASKVPIWENATVGMRETTSTRTVVR